jgi:hypothetical protein
MRRRSSRRRVSRVTRISWKMSALKRACTAEKSSRKQQQFARDRHTGTVAAEMPEDKVPAGEDNHLVEDKRLHRVAGPPYTAVPGSTTCYGTFQTIKRVEVMNRGGEARERERKSVRRLAEFAVTGYCVTVNG